MVLFTGTLLGIDFSEEASNPDDLCRKLFPEESKVEEKYRMWIEFPTPRGGNYWCELCLGTILSTSLYDLLMGPSYLNGASEVKVIFRGKRKVRLTRDPTSSLLL